MIVAIWTIGVINSYFSYSKSFEDYGRKLSVNPIIWKPSGERVKKTAMYRFMYEKGCENYFQLHDWSINSRVYNYLRKRKNKIDSI